MFDSIFLKIIKKKILDDSRGVTFRPKPTQIRSQVDRQRSCMLASPHPPSPTSGGGGGGSGLPPGSGARRRTAVHCTSAYL